MAVFNVALNFWLIPAYSWRGAAWASLASDGLLAIGCWIGILVLRGRMRAPEMGGIQPETIP